MKQYSYFVVVLKCICTSSLDGIVWRVFVEGSVKFGWAHHPPIMDYRFDFFLVDITFNNNNMLDNKNDWTVANKNNYFGYDVLLL